MADTDLLADASPGLIRRPSSDGAADDLSFALTLPALETGVLTVFVVGGRFAALEMAALSIKANGGLIPHAKHGARGVNSLAAMGSKLDGTGFENVQIEQTQVASFATVGVTAIRDGAAAEDDDC